MFERIKTHHKSWYAFKSYTLHSCILSMIKKKNLFLTIFHEGCIKIRRKPLNMLRARKNSPGYLSPSLIHSTVVPIQTWSYAYKTILYQRAVDLYSFNNMPYVRGVRHENSKSGLAVMVLSTVSVILAQRRCHMVLVIVYLAMATLVIEIFLRIRNCVLYTNM